MGYVLTEILPWILLSLGIGLALGLFVWWCRWWLGRNREEELVETRELLDARRAEVDDLNARLLASRAEVSTLSGHVEDFDGRTETLRVRIVELEDAESQLSILRSKLSELENAERARAELAERVVTLSALEFEVPGLRARIAELEDLEAELGTARARVVELELVESERAELASQVVASGAVEPDADGLRARIAELEAAAVDVGGLRARIAELEGQPAAAPAADVVGVMGGTDIELDLREGAEILGFRVKLDDLEVVGGIGPKISQLLHDSGIATWQGLSEAESDELSRILHAAGPRFQIHDPGTWPQQAGLLARGRWTEFKLLTDQLVGGRRA